MKEKVLCQFQPIDSDVSGQACLRFSPKVQYLVVVSPAYIPPNNTKDQCCGWTGP